MYKYRYVTKEITRKFSSSLQFIVVVLYIPEKHKRHVELNISLSRTTSTTSIKGNYLLTLKNCNNFNEDELIIILTCWRNYQTKEPNNSVGDTGF